jgi:heterodisulfide reductase subunit C
MSEVQEKVSNVIKAKEVDAKFKYKMSRMHGAEKVMLCFQCGTCTADCPIARFSEFYRPRRIARMVQFGLKDRLLSDKALWLCSNCFTCVDHCPQNVEIAGIVRVLRNLAVKENRVIPLVYTVLASNLLKGGYVYEIREMHHKKRAGLGLPPLPKPNLEDIEKIFQITGSSNLLKDVETFEKVES